MKMLERNASTETKRHLERCLELPYGRNREHEWYSCHRMNAEEQDGGKQ